MSVQETTSVAGSENVNDGIADNSNEEIISNFMAGIEDSTDSDEENSISDDNSAGDDVNDDNSVDDSGDEDGQKKSSQSSQPEQLDPRLLVQLGKLGLSDERAEKLIGLGSNAAVQQMIEILQETKAEDKDSTEEAKVEGPEWYKIPEDIGEEFDEKIGGVLKGMNESTKKAVTSIFSNVQNSMNDNINKIKGMFDNFMLERDLNDFDDALDGMGSDWKKFFGNGETSTLDQNTEAFRNRSKLYGQVFSGKYKGSVRKRIEQASKIIFPEDATKISNRQKAEKARKRQSQHIARGSEGNGPDSRNGDQALLDSVKEKIRNWTS